MKEAHLVYNKILDRYIFYTSRDKTDSSRVDLGHYDASGLVNELKHRMDFKRKTLLHLVDLPEKSLMRLESLFKGTKIQIKIEEKRSK